MRYLSPAFEAYRQGTEIALAVCVKITQRNSTVRYFTDWSSDLSIGGQTYRSAIGARFYTLESNAGFDAGTFAIEGLISAESYSAKELDAQVGFLSSAAIDLFQVNPTDLTMGVWPLKYGRVTRVLPKDLCFSLECEGLDAKLIRAPIVETYQIDCPFEFGDSNCTVTPVTHNGIITTMSDDFTFSAAAFAGPGTAGFFSFGAITFAALPGSPNKIKSYNSGTKTFTLFLPMPQLSGLPAVGEAFTAYKGCSKLYAACRDTHLNIENFGGFPFIPGRRRLGMNINPAFLVGGS